MNHASTALVASVLLTFGLAAQPVSANVSSPPAPEYEAVEPGQEEEFYEEAQASEDSSPSDNIDSDASESTDQSDDDTVQQDEVGKRADQSRAAHHPRSPEAAALAWSSTLASANAVVIATTSTPADALTAGVLQGKFDAPLFFADKQRGLSSQTLAEIKRLGATKAFILGGPNSVPASVERQLGGLAVERLSGTTRIETALSVASSATKDEHGKHSRPSGILLVRSVAPNGASDPTAEFSDALGAGAVAAELNQVVLLTPSNQLPANVADYLAQNPSLPVHVVGGPNAISDQVVAQIPAANPTKRIAGATRVETAAALSKLRKARPKGVTVVNAYDPGSWANGLAAATYVDQHDHTLALVHPQHVNEHLSQVVGDVDSNRPVPLYLSEGVGDLDPVATAAHQLPSNFVYTDLYAEDLSTYHMNVERWRRGQRQLARNGALDENARQWSIVMLRAGNIWHPQDWADQIRRVIAANPQSGMRYPTGENLFLHPNSGDVLGAQLHKGWHESPGHAYNMYNPDSEYVGIGVVCNLTTCYATQRFAAGA